MECPHCRREIGQDPGQRFCPFCGRALGDSSLTAYNSQDEPDIRFESDFEQERNGYCPWEDQENLGFGTALFQTIKASMFSPVEFFSNMPVRGGVLLPLLFGIIVETVGSMAAYLWSTAVGGQGIFEFPSKTPILFALLIPLFVFLGLFLWGVILHASLFLVGGAQRDFEATFRIVCYTSGPELFGIIPVIGGIISLIWKLYITVVGLREVHGISNGRAIAALLLPLGLCCGLVLIAILSAGFLVSIGS